MNMLSLHSSYVNKLPLLEHAPCSDSRPHVLVGAKALPLKGVGVSCALCVSDALHRVQIPSKENHTEVKSQQVTAGPWLSLG